MSRGAAPVVSRHGCAHVSPAAHRRGGHELRYRCSRAANRCGRSIEPPGVAATPLGRPGIATPCPGGSARVTFETRRSLRDRRRRWLTKARPPAATLRPDPPRACGPDRAVAGAAGNCAEDVTPILSRPPRGAIPPEPQRVAMDQFGFAQPVDRLGRRVVVAVALAAHRRLDAGFEQPLGATDARRAAPASAPSSAATRRWS